MRQRSYAIELEHCRAQMQRVFDSKIYRGWVRGSNADSVVIESPQADEFAEGQEYHVEIASKERRMTFRARIRSCATERAIFVITSDVQFHAVIEEMRARVCDRLHCVLVHDGNSIVGRLIDISDTGLALECPIALERGERRQVLLQSPSGLIEGEAEIRYCRPLEGKPGFRIGVRVHVDQRVSRGRWVRLCQAVYAQESLTNSGSQTA